jgi:hypothetical protein
MMMTTTVPSLTYSRQHPTSRLQLPKLNPPVCTALPSIKSRGCHAAMHHPHTYHTITQPAPLTKINTNTNTNTQRRQDTSQPEANIPETDPIGIRFPLIAQTHLTLPPSTTRTHTYTMCYEIQTEYLCGCIAGPTLLVCHDVDQGGECRVGLTRVRKKSDMPRCPVGLHDSKGA